MYQLFRPQNARISEGLGAAAVIVEGCEAGGHLGTDRSAREIVPRGCSSCKNIPVIAAGGVLDGRDIVEMLKSVLVVFKWVAVLLLLMNVMHLMN